MRDTPLEIEGVASTLEAAAREAPPSLRADEIRAGLLAELEVNSSGVRRGGLPTLVMMAGALVLAVVIGLGGAMVGALLEPREDRVIPPSPPTLEPIPSLSPRATSSAVESETPSPSPALSATSSPSAAPGVEAAPPRATAPASTPRPSPTIPPEAPPGGPPDPLPTPPVTGPPPGIP
ncbi:MAG: hypothetical protein ACRDG7_10625 [Candidatus Limnocylindria bacterium]